jgi:hypothetical protein
MTFKQILPNIYCLCSDSLSEQGSTFVRIQEFFESPKFKGKIFTHKQYREWFKKTIGKGKYTYNTFYIGFNVPFFAFEPFLQGKFDPLSKYEHKIIKLIKNLPTPFYIIGICPTDKDFETSIKHEIAHGLWFLNSKYRNYMKKAIKKLPKNVISHLHKFLKDNGYHKDVYNDEVHAYIISTVHFYYKSIPIVKRMQQYFNNIYHMTNIKDDTFKTIDSSIKNFKKGKVSTPIDFKKFKGK